MPSHVIDLADLLVGQLSLDEGCVAVDRSLRLLLPDSGARASRSLAACRGPSTRLASTCGRRRRAPRASAATALGLGPAAIPGTGRGATLAAGRAGLGAGGGTFLGRSTSLGAGRTLLGGRAGPGTRSGLAC